MQAETEFNIGEELLKLERKKSGIKEIIDIPLTSIPMSEKVEGATLKNYKELLPEIAGVDNEIEKELLCKNLAKKLNVNFRTVRSAIKSFEKNDNEIQSNNTIIVHPAYDVKNDFLSLGFRETIIMGNEPKDRNFYIIATQGGYKIHNEKVFHFDDKTIIFDQRERLLIRHEDRWRKERILSFINNPETSIGLYSEIKGILKQYIELPKDSIYGLISAWIIATYFYPIFHAFPFLFIYGKKQTGKSRLLDLLERLSLNGMKIKGVSVASMVDSIDGVKGTFLNDQAEALSDKRNTELLGILTDSYTPGGGKRRVVDMSGKMRKIIEFGTYSPKAFASIKEIDADLKDRCIEIVMLRAVNEYPYPEPFLQVWESLRDRLYRLLLTKWSDVRKIYETTGDGVCHRVRELWRPLETILKLEEVEDSEIEGVKGFFMESMQETQAELTESETEVFEILIDFTKENGEAILTASDIAERITTKPYEPISERGLQSWVGRQLNQFGLYNFNAGRRNKKRAYHFTYDHINNVYSRYHLTSGISGKVVNFLKNKVSSDDHLLKISGNEVVKDGNDTTCLPLIKTEVVNPEPLKNKGNYHYTTMTTYLPSKDIKNSSFNLKEGEL